MRHDTERLIDMLEAIDAILQKKTDRKSFYADDLLRVWCLHHLTIIGEAASRVSNEIRERYPIVPWPQCQ